MIGIGLYLLADLPRARTRFLEALDLATAAGDTSGVYTCLIFLAAIQIKGDAVPGEVVPPSVAEAPKRVTAPQQAAPPKRMLIARAVRLLGWIERQYEGHYRSMDPWDQVAYDQIVAQAKQALSAAEFDALWQQGCALTLEQALEEARQ